MKVVGFDYWVRRCGAIAVAFAGYISWRGGDGPRPTANERVLTCGDMLLDAWRMGDGEV